MRWKLPFSLCVLLTALFLSGPVDSGMLQSQQGSAQAETGRYLHVLNGLSSNLSSFEIQRDDVATNPVFAGGMGPVSIAASRQGRFLIVANQISQDVGVFKIEGERLILLETESLAGRPSSVAVSQPVSLQGSDRDSHYVYVANGDTNSVAIFGLTENGALNRLGRAVTGQEPQALAADPLGRFVLAANLRDITVFGLSQNGALSRMGTATAPEGTDNISISALAISPSGRHVFVTGTDDDPNGFLWAFRLTRGGALQALGERVPTGVRPTAVKVDPDEKFVLVANRDSDSLTVFPLDESSGSLGESFDLPVGLGPVDVAILDADAFAKRFVLAVNRFSRDVSIFILGDSGAVVGEFNSIPVSGTPVSLALLSPDVSTARAQFFVAALGELSPLAAVDDALGNDSISFFELNQDTESVRLVGERLRIDNPFSVAVDPTERFVFVSSLGMRQANRVSVFRLGLEGALREVSGSPFSSGTGRGSIAVDPSGRFVFVANRDSDDVSVFRLDQQSGALSLLARSEVGPGTGPSSVAVDPDGLYLFVANMTSGNVSVFELDQSSGALTQTEGSPFPAGSRPAAVAVDPGGTFVFVANQGANNVSAYSLQEGTLTQVTGSPFGAGAGPVSLGVAPGGRFVIVANHDSANVSVYELNQLSGALNEVSGSPFPAGDEPISISATPVGRSVVVANAGSDNLSIFEQNADTGRLVELGRPAVGDNPVSIATTAGGGFLLVANNLGQDLRIYRLANFPTFDLVGPPVSAGDHPVSVAVDPEEGFVVAANSDSGDLSFYALDSQSGRLTDEQRVPVGQSPVSVIVSPDGCFVLVADSVLEQVVSLPVAKQGCTAAQTMGAPAGMAPASLAVTPDGRFVLAANGGSSDVSVFELSVNGALSERQRVPAGTAPVSVAVSSDGGSVFTANSRSDDVSVFELGNDGTLKEIRNVPAGARPVSVAVAPDNRHVYVLNQDSSDVSIFALESGELTLVGFAQDAPQLEPRWLAIDPAGRFVLVANSGPSDVSLFERDSETGQLELLFFRSTGGGEPISLAVSPTGRFVYVTNRSSNDLSAYQLLSATVRLSEITQKQTQSSGDLSRLETSFRPRSVAVDPTGRFVFVANQGSKILSLFELDDATLSLGLSTTILAGNGPRSVAVDPILRVFPDGSSGRFVFVANCTASACGGNGGIEEVVVFILDEATGALSETDRKVGGEAPVCLAVDPSGTFLFVTNFSSQDVSVFRLDAATGTLLEVNGVSGSLARSVAVDPSGRFVAVANAGSDDLSLYELNADSGDLMQVDRVGAGAFPLSVAFNPSGSLLFAAHANSDDVRSFRLDADTGRLNPAGSGATGARPVSLAVDPTGRFVFTANLDSDDVSVLSVEQSGQLTPLQRLPAGNDPNSVAVDPLGRLVYVANRNSGDLSVFELQSNGELRDSGVPVELRFGVDTDLVSAAVHPGKHFVLATNLIEDTVSIFDSLQGQLLPHRLPFLSGLNAPISISIEPRSQHAYVANAAGNNLSVLSMRVDVRTGLLDLIEDSMAVDTGQGPVDVEVSGSGDFVYTADFDSGTISAFQRDLASGMLTPRSTEPAGEGPVSLALTPGGGFLYAANFFSNSISQYRIQEGIPIEMDAIEAGEAPIAVVVEPQGEFAYVANAGSNDISQYSIDPQSGALTPLMDSNSQPILAPAGVGPQQLAVDPAGDFLYAANAGANTVSMYRISRNNDSTGQLELQTNRTTGLGPRGLAVVSQLPRAVGNGCSQSIDISTGSFSAAFDTSLNHNDQVPELCAPANGLTGAIWFKFEPDQRGEIDVSTARSNFDTLLAVYKGSCLGLELIGCSNDEGLGRTSLLTSIGVESGQTYFIQAGGAQSAGALALNFQFTPR